MPLANAPGADGKGSQSLVISDFTAGIVGAPNSYGIPLVRTGQQVSAAFPGTYGCIAMPTGGLAPLPNCQAVDMPDTGYSGDYYDPTSGFPSQFCGGLIGTANEDRALLMAVRTPAGIGYGNSIWRLSGTWGKVYDDSADSPPANNGWLSGMLPFTTLWANEDSPYGAHYQDELVIASTWGPRDAPSGGEVSSDVVLAYDLDAAAGFVMASGRTGLAYAADTRTLFVETTGSRIYNQFSWINPPLTAWASSADPDFQAVADDLIFQTNHASPIGACGTVTSGYFLVVTQDSGGYIISGDIGGSPYVTMAPGVQPTGSLLGQASLTPLGLVYASLDNGLWVWDGGAVAQKISTQLPDDFLFSSNGPPGASASNYPQGYWYSAYFAGNWLYVSNNWIYDMVQDNWWQLKAPDDYPFMYYAEFPSFDDNSPTGRSDWVYAAPGVWNSQDLPVMAKMAKSEPATTWQWKSNLIVLDEGFIEDVNEVTMVVSGVGNFTVTLTPVDGVGQSFGPYESTSLSQPTTIRFTTSCRTNTLSVTVQATSTNQGPMALYSMTLYWLTRYPVAQQS